MIKPKLTVLCSNYNSDRWIDGYLASLNEQLLDIIDYYEKENNE